MKEFGRLEDLGKHLLAMKLAELAVVHVGLERACLVVEKDAKSRLGTYQKAEGPFQDWAPLAESTQEERERLGYTPDDPLLRTGKEIRDTISHEIHGLEAAIGSTSYVAAYQEFGTSKIPPRPFLGPAAFNKQAKIEHILGAALVSGLVGGTRIHPALGYDMEI